MSIQFNTIPIDLRSSGQYVEYNNSRGGQSLVGMPAKILLIGHKISAGSMDVLTPIRATNLKTVAGLAGAGSQLYGMFDAKHAANTSIETWIMAVPEDGAAQAAQGAVTFNGAAVGTGTFTLRIDGIRVRIGVTNGQTAATLAAALAAAINADATLPLTAQAGGGEVAVTCRWAGATGNAIDIRPGYYEEEAPPTGLAFTITAMNGGTANPDIGPGLAAVASEWYSDICVAFTDTDNIIQMEADGERRWSGMVMTDAHYYLGRHGSYGDLATFGNGRNSPNVSYIGGYNSPTAPWKWAAALAGICAYEAKQDPARPFQTLVLPRTKVLAPPKADRFDLDAREQLLKDGVSTWWVDDDGSVRLDNIITSYQRNAYGYEDASYLQVETVKTLAFLRYSMRARVAQRFPRHKLAGDSFVLRPGQFIVRPKDIRNELIALAGAWQDAGLVESIDQFKADLVVERDDQNPNRVNTIVPPDLVNQFRIFAARIDFIN